MIFYYKDHTVRAGSAINVKTIQDAIAWGTKKIYRDGGEDVDGGIRYAFAIYTGNGKLLAEVNIVEPSAR